MNAADFGHWYYLIYLVPGIAALAMLVLPVLGGGHHHGAHGHGLSGHAHAMGHGAHAGHTGHAGHGTHAAHSSHAGGNTHRAAGAAHNGPENSGRERHAPSKAVLGFGGHEQAPIPVAVGGLLLGWSLAGFWTTAIIEQNTHNPAAFVLPAFGAAILGALVTSRLIAAAFVRLIPAEENLAVSTAELIGLTGTVAYPVDGARGRVHIYDDHGTLHDCPARIDGGKNGAGLAINRDKSILVVDYDHEHDQLIVEEIA
ncbi:MAG: hypothetical protein ACLQVD_05010 [Capsulimonadaceae bacterium]